MNLVRCSAAGRLVRVGPRLLLLSPPSIRGLSTLLAHLRGVVERPEGAESDWLPELTGESAFAEYATPMGAALLIYVTTRRDHPDLSLEEIAGIVADDPPDDAATSALIQVAFLRGQWGDQPRRKRPGRGPGGKPRGIETLDFGAIYEREAMKRFSYDVLSSMSVDQFENALFGGQMPDDDLLSMDEVMEICEEGKRKRESDESAGETK